jgi:hypothetical protein
MKAGEYGLLYEKIDENGWPIDVRVGRHVSSILQVTETFSEMYPEQIVVIKNVPRYAEVIENGAGHYLHNPEETPDDRVVYE